MDTNVKWYDALQLGASLCFSSISDACSHFSVSSDFLVTPNSCCTHFVLVSPLGCWWKPACKSSLCVNCFYLLDCICNCKVIGC